ncbi:MAG: heme-binding protein [Luteolibacter sp.]
MKWIYLTTMALLVSCGLKAEDKAAEVKEPGYVDEAPLPEGWPKPGPYNVVVEKSYPAYRAAFTDGRGQSGSFWTLFAHIKRNDIPMTAPVEMTVEPDEGGGMRRNSMAFLYQNTTVGAVGDDGARVEIRDIPATRTLSYAWMGPDSDKNLEMAKQALEAALAERKLAVKSYRLLGYNGPRTPSARKTWELVALLE